MGINAFLGSDSNRVGRGSLHEQCTTRGGHRPADSDPSHHHDFAAQGWYTKWFRLHYWYSCCVYPPYDFPYLYVQKTTALSICCFNHRHCKGYFFPKSLCSHSQVGTIHTSQSVHRLGIQHLMPLLYWCTSIQHLYLMHGTKEYPQSLFWLFSVV